MRSCADSRRRTRSSHGKVPAFRQLLYPTTPFFCKQSAFSPSVEPSVRGENAMNRRGSNQLREEAGERSARQICVFQQIIATRQKWTTRRLFTLDCPIRVLTKATIMGNLNQRLTFVIFAFLSLFKEVVGAAELLA